MPQESVPVRLLLSLRLIVEILNTYGMQERVTFVVYDRQPVARSELQEGQSITERVQRKNVYRQILKEIRQTEERQDGSRSAKENSNSADGEHTAENALFEVKNCIYIRAVLRNLRFQVLSRNSLSMRQRSAKLHLSSVAC